MYVRQIICKYRSIVLQILISFKQGKAGNWLFVDNPWCRTSIFKPTALILQYKTELNSTPPEQVNGNA